MPLLIALQFLTRLPVTLARAPRPSEMGRATAFFPLVGLLLGAILAGADWTLRLVLPISVTSALLIVLLLLLTGALHLDGFADTCDGVFAQRTPERRLEIMRDSRVGSYGLAGTVTLLLVEYSTLTALSGEWRAPAIVVAPALSRWAMTLAVVAFPYARGEGAGSVIKSESRALDLVLATLFAGAVAVVALRWWGAAALAVAALVALVTGKYIMAKIPGLSGDSYGAVNELATCAVLVLLVALGQVALPL